MNKSNQSSFPEDEDEVIHELDTEKGASDDRIARAQRRWSEVLLTGKLFMPKPVHDREVPVDAQPVKNVKPDTDEPEQNANSGNFITP